MCVCVSVYRCVCVYVCLMCNTSETLDALILAQVIHFAKKYLDMFLGLPEVPLYQHIQKAI